MAVATERVVVLMTQGEKRAMEAKAKRMGASAAELVRRSVAAFDPAAESEDVAALFEVLAASHQATLAALAGAESELAATRDYFRAKRTPS